MQCNAMQCKYSKRMFHWIENMAVAAAIILRRTSYGMLLPMCNITSNVHNARIHGMHIHLYTYRMYCICDAVYKLLESEKLNYGPDLFVLLFSTFFFALHLFGLRWTTLDRPIDWEPFHSSVELESRCSTRTYFPCVFCVNEWYSLYSRSFGWYFFFFYFSFVRSFFWLASRFGDKWIERIGWKKKTTKKNSITHSCGRTDGKT